MKCDILTLFPGYFVGPFDESMIKRAKEKGILDIGLVDVRAYSDDKHGRIDDRPYGGGPGMVMQAAPVVKAIRAQKSRSAHVIALSPQGSLLNAAKCRELAKKDHLILVCGHYEGIDERVADDIDEEISIGDYVVSNGACAAIVLLDAVARFLPGFLGDPEGAAQDSFEEGIFDHPHYTRPAEFEGKGVPEILLGGDHKKIAAWRKEAALTKTAKTRPDLYQAYLANPNFRRSK